MRVRRRAFSPFSTAVLINAFGINETPSKDQRLAIAAAIGTTERRVQVWFQNRRQRKHARPDETGAFPDTPAAMISHCEVTSPVPSLESVITTGVTQDSSVGSMPTTPTLTGLAMPSYSSMPKVPVPEDGALTGIDGAAQSTPTTPALPNNPMMHVPPFVLSAGVSPEARLGEGQGKPDMKMEAYMSICAPFEFLWASDDWLSFCGFQDSEVVGRTLQLLEGPKTDRDTVLALADAVDRLDTIDLTLTHHTRSGLPFTHTLQVEPLINTLGEPVLYRVVSSNVQVILEQLKHGIAAHAGGDPKPLARESDDVQKVEEDAVDDSDTMRVSTTG